MGEVLQSTQGVRALSDLASATFASAELRPVARVAACSRTTDLAVYLTAPRMAVIRCVGFVTPGDHTALATMISEGTFIWGAIVYSESALPDPLGLVESFHVNELDQLVARLVELRGVFDEAR